MRQKCALPQKLEKVLFLCTAPVCRTRMRETHIVWMSLYFQFVNSFTNANIYNMRVLLPWSEKMRWIWHKMLGCIDRILFFSLFEPWLYLLYINNHIACGFYVKFPHLRRPCTISNNSINTQVVVFSIRKWERPNRGLNTFSIWRLKKASGVLLKNDSTKIGLNRFCPQLIMQNV